MQIWGEEGEKTYRQDTRIAVDSAKSRWFSQEEIRLLARELQGPVGSNPLHLFNVNLNGATTMKRLDVVF
jgi:hypothetical protein